MGDMESPSSEQARHLAAALLGGLDGARAVSASTGLCSDGRSVTLTEREQVWRARVGRLLMASGSAASDKWAGETEAGGWTGSRAGSSGAGGGPKRLGWAGRAILVRVGWDSGAAGGAGVGFAGIRGRRLSPIFAISGQRAGRRSSPTRWKVGAGGGDRGRREGSLAVVLRVMQRESSAIILYGSSASGGAGSEAQVKKGRSSPRHIDFG